MVWARTAMLAAAIASDRLLDDVAQSLQYQRRAKKDDEQPDIASPTKPQKDAALPNAFPPTHVPATQFLTVTYSETAPSAMKNNTPEDTVTADWVDTVEDGTYSFAPPTPLWSAAQWMPLLLNALGESRRSARVNATTLCREVARGKAIARLPARPRKAWPRAVQIIVDTRSDLAPYREDFLAIAAALRRVIGHRAVEVVRARYDHWRDALLVQSWPEDNAPWRQWQVPPNDTPVVMLSDFGALTNNNDNDGGWLDDIWRTITSAVNAGGNRCLALSPVATGNRDHDLHPVFWGHPAPPRYPLFAQGRLNTQVCEVTALLVAIAMLPLVGAGLLRKLRTALALGGAHLEGAVWNHPDVQQIEFGIRIHPARAPGYQAQFLNTYGHGQSGEQLGQKLWRLVEAHHQSAFVGLKRLDALGQVLTCATHTSLQAQHHVDAFLKKSQRLVQNVVHADAADVGVRDQRQAAALLAHLPEGVWQSDYADIAYGLFSSALRDTLENGQWPASLPNGFDPSRVIFNDRHQPNGRNVVHYWIRQVSAEGHFTLQRAGADKALNASNITRFTAPEGFPITVSRGAGTKQVIKESECLSPPEEPIWVESAQQKIKLERCTRPPWATTLTRDPSGLHAAIVGLGKTLKIPWQKGDNNTWGWQFPNGLGEDQYGLYADLTIANNARQRFRFIAPGTFMMGSPENEEGRYDLETLHQVTLTRGFWLADTAVTQRVWQAVMGQNPSDFKGPDRPVENVSWNDAQEFIHTLNTQTPGLNASLPTEAQWEYACRAGTSTAFSFGDALTPEHAQYSGQWDDYNAVGETVEVKGFVPNPWGLYQMHGNVLEWCQDAWQDDLGKAAMQDPVINSEGNRALRVVRGGSWINRGRGLRSAYRGRSHPFIRDVSIGLRVCLAPGHQSRAAEPTVMPGGAGSR